LPKVYLYQTLLKLALATNMFNIVASLKKPYGQIHISLLSFQIIHKVAKVIMLITPLRLLLNQNLLTKSKRLQLPYQSTQIYLSKQKLCQSMFILDESLNHQIDQDKVWVANG
ncbi:hypothetical protein ACJX0J_016115, partial [Zea mays]